MWDYTKVLAVEFQKLLFDDRSSILKKYYVDMTAKCSVGAGKKCFYETVSSGMAKFVSMSKANR